MNIQQRFQHSLDSLSQRGQQHALRWWDELTPDQREQLLADIESVPWDVVDPLIDSHVRRNPGTAVPDDLQPPTIWPGQPDTNRKATYQRARETGREHIAAGRIAAFTVAGGQGTRLGFEGPKGTVTITPVRQKTLFQLFAEMIRAARERYEVTIPWYLMTNPLNHEQTVGFLRDHDFFGLPEEDVMLFPQEMLPVLDFSGRLLLAEKHRLALAPDGHGGSLKALVKSGALRDMQARGIEFISYFQVDNPLVKPFDPLFIGLHALTGSEMSTKIAPKADDLERVGNVCSHQGKTMVVEYSEFPDDLAHARSPDGSRRFDAGNLAIHLLNVAFVQRIAGQKFELPYRRAEKPVTWMDDNGLLRTPREPNAVKLETFVFDALPFAQNPLVLAVDRAEEFSPVKNVKGIDSVETAIRDQICRAARWLESAGVTIPRKPDGQPDVTLEIAPLFALDADELPARATDLPPLRPGHSCYIE